MNYICYDILLHIFEYLDIGDAINARLISKQFDELYDDKLLWKIYYERDYGLNHSDLNNLSKINAYKKCNDIIVFKLKLKFDTNQTIIDIMNLQEFKLNGDMKSRAAKYFDANFKFDSLTRPKLKIIPREITQLTNLRKIQLSGNKIKEIPQMGSLVNLQSLYLSDNQITDIQQIGSLVNLQELNLSGNKIKDIQQIMQLVNLNTLFLFCNKIKLIPSQIIQLINLTKLHLSHNKITKIPLEVIQLANLITLDLRCNQIKEIPSQITQLMNLQFLYLCGNKIKKVPQDIDDVLTSRDGILTID